MILIDYHFYGRLVVVPYNFLMFNVIEGGGSFYGSHPWHWYFSQGFPAITATLLPFIIGGLWLSQKVDYFIPVMWIITIFSFLSHKEFRFLLPILPLSLMYAGYALVWIWNSQTPLLKRLTWFLLLLNTPMALYFSLIHQRGQAKVMDYAQVHFFIIFHFLSITECFFLGR